jgi:hypothetical protein
MCPGACRPLGMIVERKLRFAPAAAYDRHGKPIKLPGGIASVMASPLMDAEAVLFEEPEELTYELAPGEVGRLLFAGYAAPARTLA